MNTFSPARLALARQRRRLKQTDLAKLVGLSSRTINAYENGEFPPEDGRLELLSKHLGFPKKFFLLEDEVEVLDPAQVSFRALTKMSATLRDSALSAGSNAVALNRWIEARFKLPQLDLAYFNREEGPEAAAAALRAYWGLGEQPISNMVHLLESKGVRVFSLAIDAREVDAFCYWQGGTPFVFLNTKKSAEHSRFDAAHELGHLVLHHTGQPHGPDAEREANAFASAFLMPRASILAARLNFPSIKVLIQAKKHWGVSVAALNYRLHALGLTTEWVNRSLCIEIARAGFRTAEPEGMPRERSQLLEKVFSGLRKEKIAKAHIADELCLPVEEIEALTYGLTNVSTVPQLEPRKPAPNNPRRPPRKLSLVG